MSIDADLKALATTTNLAALAFTAADGVLRNHVMWIDADDEHVIFNTDVRRPKFAAIQANPQVTVTVIDRERFDYIEARGHVVETITGQAAADHIDALAERYTGAGYLADKSARVIVKVAVDRLHKNR